MRAAICREPFDLRLVQRPEPIASDSDVLVRISRVGLCGTDYHIYTGNQPFLTYPRVIGHELAGEVVRAPVGSQFRAGQQVTINPYLACGRCIACRRGKPNCCADIAVLGVHTDGGLCDRIAVPPSAVIDATELTLDQAAMVEFLAIGAHAVARATLSAGDRTLVVGAGPIGIATALFARLDGTRVTLLDTSPARLAFVRDRLGFADVQLADAEAYAALTAATDGEFFDAVFDATGNIAAMRGGLHYVAHGGAYVLVSVVKDDLIFPDPEFHKRETTLIASRNALADDFARVIAAIRSGDVPTDILHTHTLTIEELGERMATLANDREGVVKALVRL